MAPITADVLASVLTSVREYERAHTSILNQLGEVISLRLAEVHLGLREHQAIFLMVTGDNLFLIWGGTGSHPYTYPGLHVSECTKASTLGKGRGGCLVLIS